MKFICIFSLIILCLTGCQTKTPRYVINPPFKWNTETGESWFFAQGYWFPIRDPDASKFQMQR